MGSLLKQLLRVTRRAGWLLIVGVLLAAPAAAASPSPDWPQFDGSSNHQGVSANETSLTAANVASLGQLWQASLPTYADGAPVVAGGVNTASGVQDLAIVTTTAGDLVARNLETGSAVWSTSFGPGTCTINNGTNPCITTSSPVLDHANGYVYTYGLDGKVHKVALATGVEVRDANWPVVATLKPWDEKGSSALALATDSTGTTYLYATNSGYNGDLGDYQGHVTTINLATGASVVFNTLCSSQTVHFTSTTPDCPQKQSGVWARSGVTYSPATNLIYLATGNGDYNPALGDWGDSVLALHPDGTGVSGGPVDSYTPTNYPALQSGDIDLGSTLPALVDAPAGSTVSHLGVQGGKDGLLRLVNLANLSGQSGPGHTGGELSSVAGPGGEILTAPVVWVDPSNTTWVFAATSSNMAGYQVTLNASHQPTLTPVWNIAVGATSPVLAGGVLYAAGGTTLGAYNPATGTRLWSTTVGPIHWQSPVVVNGELLLEDGNGRLTAWAARLPQTITFTSAPPTNATVGGSPYTATATASSGLPVTLTIDASAANVCAISGSSVTFSAAGTCVIDANQPGNATYAPAPQVQQSVGVASASPTVPGAPTNVGGTPGNTSVALSWTAPTSTGGSPITGYQIIPIGPGGSLTPILTGSSATAYTVTGLTNGTPYTFTVAAINSAGTGPASTASSAVTPTAGSSGYSTVVFADGFESGTLSAWNGNTGTGSATVTAAAAHTGSFGLRLTNTSGQFDVVGKLLASPLIDSSTSFWVRFSETSGITTVAEARDQSSSYDLWALQYDATHKGLWFYPYKGTASAQIYTGNSTVPAGTWTHIEVHYTATATGGAELLINGQTQPAWTVSGNYARTTNLQRLQLWNDATPATDFDDVTIATPG